MVRAFILAFTLASSVSAFWRMPCRSRTGLARVDPLVNPGQIAPHIHAIHGGGNFGLTTTYEDLAHAAAGPQNCTSCEVLQDKSAYWTPALYFQYANGTVVLVEQIGGMLAYYLLYMDNLEPFPEGFQMRAGNSAVRNFTGPFPDSQLSEWPQSATDQFFLQQRAIGFNCLNYNTQPEPSLYRHQFPTKTYMDANCADGLRFELAFPSCGNGSLDASDHSSHVAYPSLVKEGNCPPGYDHHYPFLFFETIWATNAFKGIDGQFLLSNGDPTGTSYHGDFMMGWQSSDFLKQAIQTCTNLSGEIGDCPLFTIQTDAEAAQCTFPVPSILQDDNPTGPRQGLPVDVPVQSGPGPATEYPVAGRTGVPTTSLPSTTASTSYSVPNLPYTSAAESITATAQGGIIVDAVSSPDETPPVITPSPGLHNAADALPDMKTTTYTTNGNEVVELVLVEQEITVTATASPVMKHKRHLHRHVRPHGARS